MNCWTLNDHSWKIGCCAGEPASLTKPFAQDCEVHFAHPHQSRACSSRLLRLQQPSRATLHIADFGRFCHWCLLSFRKFLPNHVPHRPGGSASVNLLKPDHTHLKRNELQDQRQLTCRPLSSLAPPEASGLGIHLSGVALKIHQFLGSHISFGRDRTTQGNPQMGRPTASST